ncbi:hypothetical protein DUNSADRAFT_13366 [Dunaliella salina]|nr:hypothetical protein DUNSADRAFT_13366 [Dunaliella salina]|eukprot:KAF5831259.1 hypothetical protein DUNSADRAFT_13366 [Dunaliella salina]
MAVVGTTEGTLFAHTARDPLQIGKHQAHTSAITAMDVGHIAATGAKVIASASAEQLIIHDVVIKTSELRLLAQVDLPLSASGVAEAPANVSLSTNSGHVAVWWPNGAIAMYEVNLPEYFYQTTSVEAGIDAPPPDLSGGELKMVLHFPVDVVKALLVDNSFVGSCNIVWQQQQRPDKSGKSDRNHRPARGIYVWWVGCNKLTLSFLDDTDPRQKPKEVPLPEPPAPSTPVPGGRVRTPTKGNAGRAAAAAAAAAAEKEREAALEMEAKQKRASYVRSKPSKGWLLPVGITSSNVSENGKMLAFGMDDGTILVWDDHFGGHTKILPRMPAAVSAVAFVNGAFNLIFATSLDGSVYLADLNRPEDSHLSRTKLPHLAVEIYFLPNDPFAICVCPGNEDHPPRLIWFNMQNEKLIAELGGKTDNGFGRAGLAGFPGTGSNIPTNECIPKQFMPSEAPAPKPPISLPPIVQPNTPSGPRPPLSSSGTAPAANGIPARTSPLAGQPAGSAPAAHPGPPSESPPAVDGAAREVNGSTAAPPGPTNNLPKELRQLQYRSLLWPRTSFRDSYVVVGGPTPESARAHLGFRKMHRLLHCVSDLPLCGKLFKKETRSGGFSDGRSKQPANLKLDLSKFGVVPKNNANLPKYMQERPSSPPWHHTNPLARIHPDWEEAPVLSRIMDRLGQKGGGRRRRDRRLGTVASEMKGKMAKESGPKPNLIFQ